MPSITAVRILRECSATGFICWAQIQMLHINDKNFNLCILLYIFHRFSYHSLSLLCSPRLICVLVSVKGRFLWPEAVRKLPGVVLWLRCTSRGLAGRWWHRSRQRSGLLGILMRGIGWSVRWLLTHLREHSVGFWFALCALTGACGLIFALSGVNTGLLMFHWVAGLSGLRAENKINKPIFKYCDQTFSNYNILISLVCVFIRCLC